MNDKHECEQFLGDAGLMQFNLGYKSRSMSEVSFKSEISVKISFGTVPSQISNSW